MNQLKEFYQQEKAKLDRYIEYHQMRDKSIYDNDEIEKFSSYITHSSDWLRKIKQLIDGDYIFDNQLSLSL